MKATLQRRVKHVLSICMIIALLGGDRLSSAEVPVDEFSAVDMFGNPWPETFLWWNTTATNQVFETLTHGTIEGEAGRIREVMFTPAFWDPTNGSTSMVTLAVEPATGHFSFDAVDGGGWITLGYGWNIVNDLAVDISGESYLKLDFSHVQLDPSDITDIPNIQVGPDLRNSAGSEAEFDYLLITENGPQSLYFKLNEFTDFELLDTTAIDGIQVHLFTFPNCSYDLEDISFFTPAIADANFDGTVGVLDFLEVLGSWGPCNKNCYADFDNDGFVGVTDFLAVLMNWD